MTRWWVALTGLFLSIFAAVALSGPGRIDVVDGQTRFEVARSLVEHGDVAVRDPRVTFAVFPGRDNQRYSTYRLPQSLAGAVAILAADASGPIREARRHFFFTMTGAWAAALLAVTFAAYFRHQGHSPCSALLWGAGGIVCTPCWFYGTSTFDDILGTVAVVMALCCSLAWRVRRPLAAAAAGGTLAGLAFHCKQPLGLFLLPVLAACHDPTRPLRAQVGRLALAVTLCLGLVATCQLHELYRFPPETAAIRERMMRAYIQFWTDQPVTAILVMTCSLSAGVFFYAPTVLLGAAGWNRWRNDRPGFRGALAVAIVAYVAFLSCLTFFKGDPAWGPRYLTPVVAVLWLLAPAGVQAVRPWAAVSALTLGLVVQCGALCIDPHRLYVEHDLKSGFYVVDPGVYFDPRLAHLLQRPREILETLQSQGSPAERYTPSPSPTFAFPILDYIPRGPIAVNRYQVLKGFRFWWASFPTLDRQACPVNVSRTVAMLLLVAVAGIVLQAFGAAGSQRLQPQRMPAGELRSRFRRNGVCAGTCAAARRTTAREDCVS